ncbi:MAG: hypothetical protein FD143_3437 [Ignavibacteria bacterium]|nr:MAG: hypothetical protein FD143_3437 [Ignavibacteria bacterium]
MRTDDIRQLLQTLLAHSNVKFLGVFPADRLPSLSAIRAFSPCCYVANTDKTGLAGSHWVAFYHPSPSRLEFFDSFGREAKNFGYDFDKSIQITHNSTEVQGRGSKLCGQYCIFFLCHRAKGRSMRSIIRKFSQLPNSDSLVYSCIQTLMQRIKRK